MSDTQGEKGMSEREIYEAARAISLLMTPPGEKCETDRWRLLAMRALEAAERVRALEGK